MRKILLLFAGAVVLCVPAVSAAVDPSSSTSPPAAKAEKADAKSAAISPAANCKSRHPELRRRMFGDCVSAIAKHKAESDRKDSAENDGKNNSESQSKNNAASHGRKSTNPAKACKAMQANDLSHFKTTYGKRPNAFGNCVSSRANGNS